MHTTNTTNTAHPAANFSGHTPKPGDWIAYYSATVTYGGKDKLQAFTAIGRVAGKEPFQTRVTDTQIPWRRRVEYLDSEEASILPLVAELSFITDKANWGAALKGGFIEIGDADATRIAQAMKADLGRSQAEGPDEP